MFIKKLYGVYWHEIAPIDQRDIKISLSVGALGIALYAYAVGKTIHNELKR